MSRPLIKALALLYPKDWRERYADELFALCQELLESHKTSRLRLVVGLVASAFVERARGACARRTAA